MSHHSQYPPTRSDRVLTTEHEVKEAIKQRSGLKARLRALLRLEKAAYTQATADVEGGELLDPEYTYIRGPSQDLESHSQLIGSPKSKISVYKEPVGPLSLKRKANDEGDVPKAKKQQQASFLHNAPNVTHQGEREDSRALIDEGPAVIGGNNPEWTTPDVGRLPTSKERNIRKPMSRFGKDVERINVSYEGSVLMYRRPSNGTATISPEANNASISKPVNISRDPGTDVETREPARSSVQPSMGPPVTPKLPAGADSAFNQMSKRNKKALKDQKMQDAVNRKLRIDKEKEIRTKNNGRRASRQAAPKLRSTVLSKKRESIQPLAQPKDEKTPDWQRSFSTAPPKITASKPTIAQIHKGTKETMLLEKIGSTDKKRKAEEGLESSEAKIAKGNMGPFSDSRPAGPKRAVAHAQSLTDHEAIFGKGSQPRRLNIQRVCVPMGNSPDQQRRLFATSVHPEDVQHGDE